MIRIKKTALIILVLLVAGFFVLTYADAIDSYTLPSKPVAEVSRGGERTFITMECTGYTHTGNMTYSETWPRRGTVAADISVLSIGTKIYIPNYGYGVIEDKGGLIQGNKLDLFFDTEQEAIEWGRRTVTVEILN